MTTQYNILDYKATIKHSYYGCDDSEAIHCEETDKYYPTWQAAAHGWVDRYIIPILNDGSPRTLITAHDMGRNFRTALYPAYKGNREKRETSPVEVEQLGKLQAWGKTFLSALGSTQIGVEGVEADDVIAWLCNNLTYPKNVYTVDADLLQLCDLSTVVYLKNEPYFGEGEYNGVPYRLTSIAKSICGDSSDNYPGIKGLGPKKFEHLLESFGPDGVEQLRDIVDSGDTTLLEEAIEQTGDKVLQKLLDEFSTWRTMWKLAKLHPELCWKPRARKLVKPLIHKRLPSVEHLSALLAQVGCEDLWDDVFASVMPSQIAITSENWEDYKDGIFSEIRAGDVTSFDYETSDKEPIEAFRKASTSGDNFVDVLSQELAGASFCFGAHNENVIYIPIDHKDSPNLPSSVITEILEVAGQSTQLVAQNVSFEGVVTQTNLNVELRGVHDTKIMKRYYDENTESGLKFMSLEYLGYEQASYKETLGDKENMSELTLDEVFSYGADDAQVTSSLYDLLKLLLQLDGQWEFYQQWAVDPTVILQHSYMKGVKMNWSLQKELHERDVATVAKATEELRDILSAGVSGEITEGCKSLIEEEKDFVYRSAKKKYEGDSEVASQKLYEWKTKTERACQYLPYKEESIMPKFALTTKQLSAAAEAVGLPELTKVSGSGISEYLATQGVVGFDPEWPEDERQREFLSALSHALDSGALRVKALSDKLDKALESGDEKKVTSIQNDLDKAVDGFSALGECVQRLAGVEPKVISSGDELNVGSPVQMQQLLYCKIGVPVRLKGTTVGKNRKILGIKEAGPSSDEKAIQTALANDVEPGSWQESALKTLLTLKSARTRISLYHEKYPLWVHRDGKVHPSFTDAGTDTRRPTGSSPNVLQVSKKDKAMRSIFIPPEPDWVCVAIDYSGQELRIMANETGDPVMIDAYIDPDNEKDLHSVTGAGIAALKGAKSGDVDTKSLSDYELFNQSRSLDDHPLNKLAEAIRKGAKGVNFGLCYGAAAPTLSRNMIVPLAEAEDMLNGAMKLYAQIPVWQDASAKYMERNGFTKTAFGTKRHATEDVFSKDRGKSSRQHRQGANAIIQGTAAEMLRIVLTKMVQRELIHRLRMHFFAPIYDEVVAFVHKDDVVEYCREMDQIMRSATPPTHKVLQIPEFSIGPDWGRVHELGRWPGEEAIKDCVDRCLEEATDIWKQVNEQEALAA